MIFDTLSNLIGNEIIAGVIVALLPLFLFILPYALMAVLAERKVSAFMQDRVGPNRVGPKGLLQTVADILKLLQKEDIMASDVDKPLFNIAPVLVFTGSYAAFAVIPFTFNFIGSKIDLGIIYLIGVSSLVVAGILSGLEASTGCFQQ